MPATPSPHSVSTILQEIWCSKVSDLELKVKKLAKSKEVIEPCQKCEVLTQEVYSLRSNVSKLQDEALNFSKFKKSSVVLDDMLSQPRDGITSYTRRRHNSSSDGITSFLTASARTDSNADLEDSSYDGVTTKTRRWKRDCVERIPSGNSLHTTLPPNMVDPLLMYFTCT
ncbi:hypothetical protein Tco_0273608 [Tanacetum coccineum]